MKRLRRLHASASCVAITAAVLATPAFAQQAQDNQNTVDQVIITGIRASLERSIAIKRDNSGVVDAISAEDMGKFPDTNLAESLQRITGVSIDRTNGEGSQVTVRGFGPSFNLVTLNGRSMPTAKVAAVGGDQSSDSAAGTSRSFDFSNLASEGVTTLEVYKTGRAAVPSGGIGATINVKTRRPLDNAKPGLTGSIGVKGAYDTSMDKKVDDFGSKITPEASGLVNWVNDNETFGVTLFGSYQKRDFTSRSATSNDWNMRTFAQFNDPANGFVRAGGATQIVNAPSNPNTLVAIPNDSRYHFAQGERERINGQASVQYRPVENFKVTLDGLYAQNKQFERRNDSSNWFNRPFDKVVFDTNPVVATALLTQETLSGTKDMGFEQQYRATKDTLKSIGLNADWDVTDKFKLTLDGHISKADSRPDASNGASSTAVAIGAPIIASHQVDYSGEIPVQTFTINDAAPRGNGNGKLDIGDLGSQVARTWAERQRQDVKEIRLDGRWDLDDKGSRFDFGVDYRTSKMIQTNIQTQQDLGTWGISAPGDVQKYAGSLVKQFCLACQFDDFNPKQSGPGLVSFRANALDLYNALSPVYKAVNPVQVTGQDDNRVKEDIAAAYAQVTWKAELAGMPTELVTGVRYETTKTKSTSLVRVPSNIIWTADNDFSVIAGNTYQPVSGKGSYHNLLPSMDFRIDLRDNLTGRFSFSRTIARPEYGNLFASASIPGNPNRPTANGGIPLGASGNPGLAPLISDNFDVSLEWYYKPSSYISIGFFDKQVTNFVGTGTQMQNLFGLRDASAAGPGSRSEAAKNALSGIGASQTDVNLFTMTALIQQTGSVAAATAQYQAHRIAGGDLDQTYADQILAAIDITPNSSDPLYNFQVSKPINNKTGKIHGFEIAAQHFFGDTGFGVAGAYTKVSGDVGFDNAANPNEDQFALLGLSDTANATLIYDKHGLSARVAYNWRDRFLQATNRGGGRNPVNVEPFGQVDFSVSYDVTPKLSLSFEGINLTNEHLRTYARDENELWFAQELDRRFLLGARYRF